MKRLAACAVVCLVVLLVLRVLTVQLKPSTPLAAVNPTSSGSQQAYSPLEGDGSLSALEAAPHAWGHLHDEDLWIAGNPSPPDRSADLSQLRHWRASLLGAGEVPQPQNFQALLDATPAPVSVEVPVGYWRVDTTLLVHSHTTLRGADSERSCLVATRGDIDLIALLGSQISVENLCLVGPGGIASDGGNGPGRGVVNPDKRVSLAHVVIRGLRIINLNGTAVEMYGNWNARLADIVIEQNSISHVGGHGIYAGFIDAGNIRDNLIVDSSLGGLLRGDGAIDAEGSTGLTIEANVVDSNMAAGIQGNNLSSSTVRNNLASRTHGGPGFSLWNCSHLLVAGNLSKANDNEGFYWSVLDWLPPGGSFLTIDGNTAQDNGLSGFYIARHSDVQFTNNLAVDNNQRDAGHSGLLLHFSNQHLNVAANTFLNSRVGKGQQYGVATDTSTSDLKVENDNTFVRMRSADVQPRYLVQDGKPSS